MKRLISVSPSSKQFWFIVIPAMIIQLVGVFGYLVWFPQYAETAHGWFASRVVIVRHIPSSTLWETTCDSRNRERVADRYCAVGCGTSLKRFIVDIPATDPANS